MALQSTSNDAFVRAVEEFSKRTKTAHRHGIAVVQRPDGLFDLTLANISGGIGRTIDRVEFYGESPAVIVPLYLKELRSQAGDEPPVFRDREGPAQHRCWELVDNETLEPIHVDGKPVVMDYVHTIC